MCVTCGYRVYTCDFAYNYVVTVNYCINMSSTKPEDDALAKMEKNKAELSTSCDSNANPDLESSCNTTTKDITCSSLDPPAITTDTSQIELILDSNKSINLDKEGNLSKKKNTGDGDNTPIRSITPSDLSPTDNNSESPDFNIFKKTVNIFDLPHSFTRTSPSATDSSELMEEDMVLKWDDDDEELEKIEGKSEERDINPNIEDIVENKTTVSNKLNDSEILSNLENKVIDTNTDISTINECSIEMESPEKSSNIAECTVVDQENDKEPKTEMNKNTPVDNPLTNLEEKVQENVSEDKSVTKEKVDSNWENNLSDSTKIESASKEPFGVAVDHEEVEENSQMDVEKDTFSIDNVIRSLDQMIDDKVSEEKLSNAEHIDSSLDTKNVDTKTDQKQTDSAEAETDTEKPLPDVVNVGNNKDFPMDIDKVTTSIDNIITNLAQVINNEIAEDKLLNEENVDSSLDTDNIYTKTDQKLTDSTEAETGTEKPFSDVINVGNKEGTSMDVDKVATSIDNIITNLAQVINDKIAEDKPNEENVDSSLETEKIDTKAVLKLTDSAEAETVIEKPLSDVVNVGTKEDTPMDVDEVMDVDNIITNMAQIIDDKTAKENPKHEENVCLFLDSKTDQIQSDFKDSASKHITGKPSPEGVNVVKKSNEDQSQIDKDEFTTPIDNFITNLDQITDEKVAINEINKNNMVSSLDIKTDQKRVDLSDSKSGTESPFMQARNEGNKMNEKDTQIDIDKVTTSIEKPITRDNEDSFRNINTDIDTSVKTVSEKEVVEETATKTIEKSIDLDAPSKLQNIVSPTQEENRPLEESSNIYSQNSAISDNVTEEKCADIILPAKSISKPGNSSESDMSTSESFLDATLEEKEHNLSQPNMMIEIPSQNIIDFTSDDVDSDSQKKENIPQKNPDKFEFLKIDSNIKDSKIQDLDKNLEKTTKQISSVSKTELSVGVKEMDSDKIVTEVTNQIDSKQPIKEVSSTNKTDSDKIQDKTEPLSDLVKPPRTTDQTDKDEPKASSSQMDPDMSDEVPEVTDSLGLLAESFRVMEDDEEQETSDHDEGDDEEDFDPDDEGSNEMTAELSEDSNPQESGSDIPKDKPITQADVHTELDIETDNAQDIIEKIVENDYVAEMETEDIQFESNAEAEVADKEVDLDIEEDMVIDEVPIAGAAVDSADLPNQPLDALESAIIEAAEELEKVESVDEPAKQAVVETVKLSDTSDAEEDAPKKESFSLLKKLLAPTGEGEPTTASETLSPTKAKKLEISKPKLTLNFVDLEESSSEDVSPADVQEVPKDQVDDVTTVNIPNEIEIMSVGGNTSDIVSKDKEIVISGVPKPPPGKPARLNTSEVTIKTTPSNEPTPALVIPEVGEKDKTKCGLEVYSLDSDEEEAPPVIAPVPSPEKPTEQDPPKPPEKRVHKCINDLCTSDSSVPHFPAPRPAVAMYAPHHTKKAQICERCAQAVVERSDRLVSDIRSFAPLLHLDMGCHRQELVEISDSDSEDEVEEEEEEKVTIGEKGAAMLDDLTEMINESWLKFRMDARLKEAKEAIKIELDLQEKELEELGAMLDECQASTDKLRTELYLSFEPEKKELPALVVFDTPDNMYSFVMPPSVDSDIEKTTSGQYKRRHLSVADTPNKKVAVSSKNLSIPLGFTPLEALKSDTAAEPKAGASTAPVAAPAPAAGPDDKNDDDKDISVVRQSVESAPASLPPHGEPVRPKVHVGMQVYAMRNAFGTWLKAKVVECTPKGTAPSAAQFSQCRVKFESSTHKNAFKTLPARCLAYSEPSEVRMTIGTRIIALYKDMETKREAYYSGLVAEVPNPVNSYRYLVFFDDGYTQYVQHADTRLVCEFSALVWDEVHPFSREFVRQYLLSYPERPMVRLHTGQSLKTELDGKWWSCKVLQVDASLVHVHFENYKNNKSEWIYRGSTRLAPLYLELQAAERQRARPLPRNRLANQTNMPYVEYTRSEEQTSPEKPPENIHSQIQAQEELRRQRAVAKKSTSMPPSQPQPQPQQQTPTVQSVGEGVTSRVVYYTPKNAVKPYKMRPHACSPQCKRNDVLSLKELRTYNPLARPLLSGWERQLVRFKGHKEVMYRAPCGRRLRDIKELHRYLRTTRSEMSVDLFDFAVSTHCLAEFVLNKCIVSKKDLSNGKENVPVPCVNYYDDSLPEFCSYNTERTPTEGVPLNLDPDFLCGCDCTDDCEDKTKCACWKLTLEGARTIGIDDEDVGYVYRRLPEPLNSGIYECNSRCKCKQTCLNRVAQHPLQLKLQVFKTINRGWGIRALNDVPKGAFLCVYAGNLLTDATANLDGLNEGDEYLAELDYIEVVEQMKEGYEEDIPEADKRLDRKESGQASSPEHSSSEDEGHTRSEQNDGDFQPSYIGPGVQDYRNRLRKRNRIKKKGKDAPPVAEKNKEVANEECITISDDEELREPARFAAQPGMGGEFISKYRSVRSHFGEDEACYIMDAKVQGNIGRYLNHSCTPNVFVQNVFVDTHDPRFPWVAFFALRAVRAGTELTWNYNYDVGSVPGKVLYCYCGATNCRGRLL